MGKNKQNWLQIQQYPFNNYQKVRDPLIVVRCNDKFAVAALDFHNTKIVSDYVLLSPGGDTFWLTPELHIPDKYLVDSINELEDVVNNWSQNYDGTW